MNRRFFLELLSSSFVINVLYHKSSGARQAAIVKPIIFYVSTKGNDSWLGLSPNPDKISGPFATIVRARDAVRQLKEKQGGSLKQPVKVVIRGGTYFVEETIIFNDRDSGTGNTPIVYQAYRKEVPIISGGKIIKDWEKTNVNGKIAWTAIIPKINQKRWLFHQIWIDGKRAQPCRYPKKGYFKVERALDLTSNWQKGQNRFQYHQGNIKAWEDLDNGEIIIMSRWLEARLSMKEVDEQQRIVVLDENTPIRIEAGDTNSTGAGIFYMENILEFLTDSGEYYIDRKTDRIIYIPFPGQENVMPDAIAPRLEKLIEIKGDSKNREFVEHLLFDGLTFSHGEWYYPENRQKAIVPNDKIFGFNPGFRVGKNNASNLNIARVHFSGAQASFGVPGFISTNFVRYCSWNKCIFSHIGSYAIDLSENSTQSKIINCQFNDLGAGAIKIGSAKITGDGGNIIDGCHMYNGGIIFHSAVAIWIGKSSNNIISKNHIHHFYYSGISVGWTWGITKKADAASNLIEKNHIHHLGKNTKNGSTCLNDKGAIYLLGNQPKTIIRGNYIHDIDAYNFGAWGIYLDLGSSNILIENNVVYDTRDGGLIVSYSCMDNVATNNIFAYGRLAQIHLMQSNPKSSHKIITFKKNIVYWDSGNLFEGRSTDMNIEFNDNIYWNTHKENPIKFREFSWEQWKKKGMDINSRITDPLFLDSSARDFRLKSKSPAFKLGFK